MATAVESLPMFIVSTTVLVAVSITETELEKELPT